MIGSKLSNKLDVVFIVQDEQEMMPFSLTALETALPCLHEVIVVDGGSRDDTLSVCRSFAARLPLTILQRPFDNFGAQFNYGLDQCHAEYIMTLGADMVVPGQTLRELFAIRYWRQAIAWNVPLIFTAGDLRHHNTRSNWGGPSMRLFKNIGMRYRRLVHEQLCFPNGETIPDDVLLATAQFFILEISQLKSDLVWLNRFLRYRRFAEQSASEGVPIDYMLGETLSVIRDRAAHLGELPKSFCAMLNPRLFELPVPWQVGRRMTADQIAASAREDFAWLD